MWSVDPLPIQDYGYNNPLLDPIAQVDALYGGTVDPATNDPSSPWYIPPDVGGNNTSGTPASGSFVASIAGLAASLGSTVSNVLNAQKYGYQLGPAGGGVGTAAVPRSLSQNLLGGSGSSSMLLILLVIGAVFLFRSK
jgi:hypothetical protein